MTSIATMAARNNATWCDIVARAHGCTTATDDRTWTSSTRTPPLYPDAVTLVPNVAAAELLDRVDASPGCSVKDSFAALELGDFGFDVLFEASWFSRRLEPTTTTPSGWQAVETAVELEAWERAWRGGNRSARLFVPQILDDERVTVGQLRSSGSVTAGAILCACDGVVGVTNFFGPPRDAAAEWSACVAFASERFGDCILVGYGPASAFGTLGGGFTSEGPLRVWVAPPTPSS